MKKETQSVLNQKLFTICNNIESPRNREKIVESLLKKGADPNTEGALEQAAFRGKTDIVKVLLETGRVKQENIQEALERNIEGMVYHFTAPPAPHLGFPVAKLLLEKGAMPTKNMYNFLYEQAANVQKDPDLRRDQAVKMELELYLSAIELLNTYVKREEIYCLIL